jgi:hypothetical protein
MVRVSATALMVVSLTGAERLHVAAPSGPAGDAACFIVALNPANGNGEVRGVLRVMGASAGAHAGTRPV